MNFLEIAGSRKRNPNWTVIRDVQIHGGIVYDLRKLPITLFKDSSFDGIYSEHFIEHLTKNEGISFLKEMKRLLKPGGVLRTVWPSRDFVNKLLDQKNDLSSNEFVKSYYSVYVVKHEFCPKEYRKERIQDQVAYGLLYQKGEHKHLWYIQELKTALSELGFQNVSECEYGKSTLLKEFNGIEKICKIRQAHSSVIECKT